MESLRLQRLLLAAEAEAEQLRRELADARRERNEILGSRYWRAGETLRRVSTGLRRLRDRLRPESTSTSDPPTLINRAPVPPLPMRIGAQRHDPGRPTLLVVSHEASATGAPILALNLCQAFATSHNLVAVLLVEGALQDAFTAACCGVLGPAVGAVNGEALGQALAALPGRPWPQLALVNSVESRGLLPALFELAIPSLALLHEFPAYTRPLQASTEVFLWADAVVFSCGLTRDDTLAAGAPAGRPPVHVLPQGRCSPPAAAEAPSDVWAIPELARWRLGRSGPPPRLILGAGAVQPRKGVDLFIATAAAMANTTCSDALLFVWIGSGYDPINDLSCSAWLQDQIQRSGLEHRLLMLPASSAYTTLLQACDAYLLTSRLDPLPNVAIDALGAGKPVLAYERASGIAELLASDNELAAACLCPYLQPQAMAERLVALLMDQRKLQLVAARSRELAERSFAMADYCQGLQRLGDEAAERLRAEEPQLQTIAAAGLIDPDFFGGAHLGEPRLLAGLFLRQWERGLGARLPFPGFHPGIYREQSGNQGDGFCTWLASGRPEGPWSVPVIRCNDAQSPAPLSLGLHLHVFYPELLPELLQRLSHNRCRPQLILTLPKGVNQKLVEQLLAEAGHHSAELRHTPNMGRDIGPLLVDLGLELEERFDVHGHLHTKRSELVDGGVARRWRTFLLGNLLGQPQQPMLDAIQASFSADPLLGLVFAEDPNAVGWSDNLLVAEALAPRLGLSTPLPRQLRFPVGTMFWARRGALRQLYSLGMSWHDLPPEPLGYDGSLLHALERLLPLVAEQAGYGLAVTHVPGLSR